MGEAKNPLLEENGVTAKASQDPITQQFVKSTSLTGPVQLKGVAQKSAYVPDMAERERLNVNISPDFKGYASAMGVNQSAGEVALRTVGNFGTGLVGGFAAGTGALLDFMGTFKMLSGMNDEYGNAVGDWADKFMEKTHLNIYQTNNSPGVHLGDGSWWGKQIGNSGYSAGIMLQALAETALVTYATGGTGLAAQVGRLGTAAAKVFKQGKKMEALKGLVSVAKNSDKIRNSMMLAAGFKGMNELYLEGVDSYKEVKEKYQTLRENGEVAMTDQQIEELASAAATTTARWNLVKVANDVLQARLLTVNPMTGGTKGFLDDVFGKIPNQFASKALGFGVSTALEGVEEYYQYIAAREGVYTADALSGRVANKDALDRFVDYQKEGDLWDAFAGGIIGGVVLGGIQTGMQKLMADRQGKAIKEQHQSFINGMNGMGFKMAKQIAEFDSLGEVGKSSAMRRVMGQVNALNSIHLDTLNDSDAAFGGYMTFLTKTLEAAEKGNVDALKAEFGENADADWVKANFPTYIRDAQKVESLYNTNKEKYDIDTVMAITQREYDMQETTERLQQITPAMEIAKTKIPDYANLSTHGKQLFEAYVALGTAVSKEQKAEAQATVDRLEKEQVDAKVLAADAKIMKAMGELSNSEFVKLYAGKQISENNLELLRDELIELKSPEMQGKNKREKVEFLIDSSKDVIQLEERAKQIDPSLMDKQMETKIANKKKKLLLEEEQLKAKQRKQEEDLQKSHVLSEVDLEEQRADASTLVPNLPGLGNQKAAPQAAQQQTAQQTTQQAASQTGTTTQQGQSVTTTPVAEQEATPEEQAAAQQLAAEATSTVITRDPDEPSFEIESGSFFSPAEEQGISPEKKAALKDSTEKLYEVLKKKLGRAPMFSDMVESMQNILGEEKAAAIEKMMALGWKLAGFGDIQAEIEAMQAFQEAALGALQQQTEQSDPAKVHTDNKLSIDQFHLVQSQGLDFEDGDFDESTLHTGKLKTSADTLKLAFRSLKDNDVELEEDAHINHKELLNPEEYGPGTKLQAKVLPEAELDAMIITVYQPDGGTVEMPFGKWKIGKTPEQIRDTTPILVYNEKGVAVARVHDPSWYNPHNVGKDKNPQEQQALINSAQAQIRELRSAILGLNGQPLTLTITEKKPGTKIMSEEEGSINSKVPHAIIGASVKGTYDMQTEQGLIPLSNIVNPDLVVYQDSSGTVRKRNPAGYKFILIPASKNAKGGMTYIAMKVAFNPIVEAVRESAEAAIRVYLHKHNPTPEIEAIHSRVLELTGGKIDLYNPQQLDMYLHMFLGMNRDPASSAEEMVASINSNPNVLTQTPFLALQNGTVIFGKKGVVWGSAATVTMPDGSTREKKPEPYLFMAPPKAGDQGALAQAEKNLKKLVGSILPAFKQNISFEAIQDSSTPMVLIRKNEEGGHTVGVFKASNGQTNYGSFLKDQFTTKISSMNIGTAENPVYTSFAQPTIHFTYEKDGVESVAAKAAQEAVAKLTKAPEAQVAPAVVLDVEALKSLGWTQAEIDAAMGTEGNAGQHMSPAEEQYQRLTDEMLAEIKKKMTSLEELDVDDKIKFVESISRQVEEKLDAEEKPFTTETVNEAIAEIMDQQINKRRADTQKQIELLETLVAQGRTNFIPMVEKGKILLNSIETLDKAWPTLKKDIIREVDKNSSTGISKDSDAALGEEGETETNYSKSSLEKNGKDSVTAKLKRFFSRIPEYMTNGEVKRGFLGVPMYPGFDFIYDQIGDILSSPVDVHADFDSMIRRLREEELIHPWIKEAVRRLEEAPDDVKRAWVSSMSNHTIKPKFLMWEKRRGGNKYSLKVYDTNATEKMRVIQTQWVENFKISALSKLNVDGLYELDRAAAGRALAIYNDWMSSGKMLYLNPVAEQENENLDEMRAWLHTYFGLKVTRETLRELKAKGFGKGMKWAQLFDVSGKTEGIFGLLAKQLTMIQELDAEKLLFEEEGGFHPFNNASGALKKLANIEKKYTASVSTSNYRDGEKSVYGRTPNKFGTQQLDKLRREDGKLIFAKRALPFEGKSETLRLMAEDKDFRDKVSVDHIGIQSIQEMHKKTFGVNEITSLSEADYNLLTFGFFQDLKQGEVSSKTFNGIPMRMGRMLFPTMSDKTTMLAFATAVLRLNRNHLFANGEVKMSGKVKELLFSQIVEPELNRILDHHKKARLARVSANDLTNQKGYNMGAQLFHMLPAMNNVQYKGMRLIEYMAKVEMTESMEQELLIAVEKEAYALLEKTIEAETDKMVESLHRSNFVEMKDGKISQINYLDGDYMQRELPDNVSLEHKLRMAAMDFVINSMYTNANHYMTFVGDIANFVVDSKFASKKLFKDGNIFEPLTEDAYTTAAKDVLGVNTGKRLAYLLAPGTSLFNSVGDTYVQLFLDDKYSVSTNAEYLISLYYGKDALTEAVKKDLETLRTTEDKAAYNKAMDSLKNKFDKISNYFKIESTNAQEYTTAKEALDVIYRLGRLPGKKYTALLEKLRNQQEAERLGRPIAESDYFTDEEQKLVFNPLKPVVSGHMQEDTHTRVIYVKTSSFPLLPQLTQGTELDGVRKALEDLEKRSGKNVRASYDSGNKVGSTSRTLTIWNAAGEYIPGSIDAEKINTSLLSGAKSAAMYMDRENFRIQQDVPYKSNKRAEDTTPLGTQMMKLFFGDGIANITEQIFAFKGVNMSGQELHRQYNELFEKWIKNEKSRLYQSLGIDENTGQPIDKNKTIARLGKLLKEEAEKRDFPLQDLQALDVIPVMNKDGEVLDMQFAIPLWMSPNSHRYESLLNSIVTNRMLKLKLPGNSFVAASEAGFIKKKESELTAEQKGKIVYTKSYKGKLEAAFDENGGLKKAQVFMPSKFRGKNGKLIDLIKDGYAKQDSNGVWMLDEEKISPELLTSTTFRIPTSGLSSLAQVEIVGFLPQESGDLIILPQNFTEQMGLDFDVDKQNAYSLWHGLTADGRIVPIDSAQGYDSYEEMLVLEKQLQEALEQTKLLAKDAKEFKQKFIEEYKDEIIDGVDDEDYHVLKERIIELKKEIKEDKKTYAERILQINDALKDLSKHKSKYVQNEISRTYTAILSSADERVQKKVNQVLSLDEAKDQAELISSLGDNTDNSLFTPLSPIYQRQKMELGAAGKSAIGIYSNYVVFHALTQQTEATLQLQRKEMDENGKTIFVPFNLSIGNLKSEGKLGLEKSLGTSGRMISEVLGERQNTALDNEKEQIMGRVGVNEFTINVDSLLTLLGFDQDTFEQNGKKVKISIPYFLLSQPIIKEYVEAMKMGKSTISEFNKKLEAQVVDRLKSKYGGNDTYTQQELENNRVNLTGKALYDNLNSSTDNLTQQTVLDLFLEINRYADEIRNIQGRLNIQRSGLGKSMYEMLDKYDGVRELAFNPLVKNVDSLIGDFILQEEFSAEEIEYLQEQGYVFFGTSEIQMPGTKKAERPYAVKPTTFSGSLVVHAAKAGHELWAGFFPHRNPVFKNEVEYILEMMSDETTSTAKKIELRHKIFEELKKFLYSSDKLGVFSGDPQEQRERLFFDSKDNTSLAYYLNSISDDKNYPGSEAVRRNKLASRFRFTFDRKAPSLIKYDNNKGEDVNEEYKYAALLELMDKDLPLPPMNGQEYSTRKLGLDLLSYAYLEGGVQEAIQFVKYIPIPLLQVIGFAKTAQSWQWMAANPHKSIGGVNNMQILRQMFGKDGFGPSRFAKQFAQHNASKIYKRSAEDIKTGLNKKGNVTSNLADMETIVFSQPIKKPFVSIYNEKGKGKNKFQLYQFDGEKYVRVPVIGAFGMSEYSIKSDNVLPLSDKARVAPVQDVVVEPAAPAVTLGEASTHYKLDEGNLQTTLQEIINANLPMISEFAKAFLPHIDHTVKLVVGDVVDSRGVRQNGLYDEATHTITIDRVFLSKNTTTQENVAKVFMEEFVHSLTVKELKKYFHSDGRLKVNAGSLPAPVMKLHRVYTEMVKALDKKEEGNPLSEFKAHFAKTGVLRAGTKDYLYYSAHNIFEFSARIFSHPEVLMAMDNVEYKETGDSLLQRFIDAITSILKMAGVNLKDDAVAKNGMQAVFSFVVEKAEQATETDPLTSALEKAESDLLNNNIDTSLRDRSNDEDFENTTGTIDEVLSPVEYEFKAVEILSSQRGEQVFEKGQKNNWPLDKILTELQIPKEQKEMILSFGTSNREQILTNLLANYSYTIEINTAKKTEIVPTRQLTEEEIEASQYVDPYMMGVPSEEKDLPTQYYSDLTAPGGTNGSYREQNFETPLIKVPKSHAQFNTENTIGFNRNDDRQVYTEKDIDSLLEIMKKSGVLEVNCG